MNKNGQIIIQGNRFGKLAAMKKMVKEALARKEAGGGRHEILIVDYRLITDTKESQDKTTK